MIKLLPFPFVLLCLHIALADDWPNKIFSAPSQNPA